MGLNVAKALFAEACNDLCGIEYVWYMQDWHVHLIIRSHLSISFCPYIRMAVINRVWIQPFIPVPAHLQRWYEEAAC